MKYIIANWKMNMEIKDILSWTDSFEMKESLEDITLIVAPSAPHLFPVSEILKNTAIKVASQDVSIENKGAHTGETGAFQIKELCNFSVVGHSERKEPVKKVLKKIEVCLAAGITPIACFVAPEAAKQYERPGVLLAWEDPANISKDGVYNEKKPEDIVEGIKNVRKVLSKSTPLLYGGSVNRQNIKNLVNIDGLNGVLVGNASLDPKHFSDIVCAYL